MDKIKNLVNFKSWRSVFEKRASRISNLSPIFTMFEFAMPLLLGISVGWLGTILVDYSLASKRAELQLSMAENIAATQNKNGSGNGLNDFISANPFSITAYPVEVAEATVVPQPEVKPEVRNSFTTAILTGTFTDIGVYLQDSTNNKQSFILVGESFDKYKLTEALYDRAIFQDEEENDTTKFLYFADANIPVDTKAYTPPPLEYTPQSAYDSQIVSAIPGVQNGVIDREVINNLMMNPFDEMKRFRIRPKFEGNEPVGIEIQWLQNDSILGKLGVQKGDVMRSVNGIPMKNMGDITNAINSLMNSSRFDVEVLRGNAPTQITYEVR